MRNITKIFILILSFILGGFAVAATVTNTVPSQKKQDQAEYLFIHTAQSGSWVKDKTQKNTFVLTLKEVDPWVTYFTNVPKRITGFMSLNDFNQLLDKETKEVYKAGLNSGIIALTGSNDQMVRYVISIKAPSYDPKTKVMTIIGHVVPGAQKNPIPDQVELKHISLFIDSVCATCGGGGF